MRFITHFLMILCLTSSVFAKTVRYELVVDHQKANLSGKKEVDFALTINGQIPAPTLVFTEGDEAEITVKNHMHHEVSIHWHGILLPPEMDGVPYVNTPPIREGESFVFRFPIRQHGTYWYHSHTHVQEQKGLYGGIVIYPKNESRRADHDVVAVLSDWTDENPDRTLKNLRKDGDYYLYKKGTQRSWWGAIRAGKLSSYLANEWSRMGGMDYSDVGYDAFLINGKRESTLLEAKPGESIRLRIINAAASTYFHVQWGNAPMEVISADGVDLEPVMANRILVGMAETYDVWRVAGDHAQEFKITAQDGTGKASAWTGSGEKIFAPALPPVDLYASMNHQHMDHSMHHHGMSHEKSMVDELGVDQIQSPTSTAYLGHPRHDFTLVLDGDMERYIWTINGKTIAQDRTIHVREGDVVRFTIVNRTMMHHPMHLHGHFFRVLNRFNDRSPLKHTVDVSPHTTRQIEFLADEPGEWMLHCHNLYHLKTGMARVVQYMSYRPTPSIQNLQKQDPHMRDSLYFYSRVEAASNHAQGNLRGSQTWNEYDLRVEGRGSHGKYFSAIQDWELEGDALYRRWMGKFLNLTGGGIYFNHNLRAAIGASYRLPFLIETQVLIDHAGHVRLDAEKRFSWTKTIYTDVDLTYRPGQRGDIERPLEYEVSLMYSPRWSWAAGLMLTEDGLGAGLSMQF